MPSIVIWSMRSRCSSEPNGAPRMLPIPGTTSTGHLKDNLAAADVRLSPGEVDTITGLMPEDD
jgi:aryl-alcohol dehydrogenase-like predicted oxidoreductase